LGGQESGRWSVEIRDVIYYGRCGMGWDVLWKQFRPLN
jgi:hypothetical protein